MNGGEVERTLQEVADELGVHYMTTYRYVRLGMLPARKVGSTWRVKASDVAAFRESKHGAPPTSRTKQFDPLRWVARLESRLTAGDANGAWSVLEAALASGAEVDQLYLEVISPALVSIGDRWSRGEIDIADEHRASAVTSRLLGRLGPRFSRPGRTRGSVVLGASPGDAHGLPVAMVADLVVGEGFEVIDLGPDVPSASFVHAARRAARLIAVGVAVTTPGLDASVMATVDAVHQHVPGVPVVVGGGAVADADHAVRLGADAYASDGRAFVATLDRLRGLGRGEAG
ncbi:MAG: B12-binding domain-containing protein [Actinomycetota bacterium]|nr:B12-binding domain-containing protein [Actinomycetota bacterium]